MVFALLGLGLNIVVGYAGLLDLGYVFFFTLGAYSLALLTGRNAEHVHRVVASRRSSRT